MRSCCTSPTAGNRANLFLTRQSKFFCQTVWRSPSHVAEGGSEPTVGVDMLGVQGKARYVLGDFVTLADLLPEADITLLGKVVCW